MSVRWALFLSGRGSTAQALMDLSGDLDLRLVVSSKKSAYGLKRARRAGLPIYHFSKEGRWGSLSEELKRRRVQAVFLVGFMRLLPAEFLKSWQGRIFNVHPSLLPTYPGSGAMESSFQDQSPMGVTLHEVTAEMDAGPQKLKTQILSATEWPATQLRMARSERRILREWSHRWQEGSAR